METIETKESIVIFSSGNQTDIAEKIERKLKDKYDCVTWKTIFTRIDEADNYALLPILLKKIPTFDFAVIIGGADDKVKMNRKGEESEHQVMRDNLIFEVGLSVMALGQERTILVADESIRFIDDFIGAKGVKHRGNLTPDALGFKCITFKNKECEIDEVVSEINEYISEMNDHFMPIVIGASCSTAIGYYNNFIKKFTDRFEYNKNGSYSKAILEILIPESIDSDTDDKRNGYYKVHNYVNMESVSGNEERDLSFRGKIENKILYVIDIPTTIGTSYDTAIKILSLEAVDVEKDDSDKVRFLRKEVSIFHKTIEKFIKENTNKDVEIKISRVRL